MRPNDALGKMQGVQQARPRPANNRLKVKNKAWHLAMLLIAVFLAASTSYRVVNHKPVNALSLYVGESPIKTGEFPMPTYTVSNAAELLSALSKAQAGDSILLNGGSYGDVTFGKLAFASDVVIKSADPGDPAVFRSILVTGSSGLAFQNVAVQFTPTATTLSYDSAVKIASSSNISFEGVTVTGGPAVNGVDPLTAIALDSTGNVLGYPCARGFFVTGSSDVSIVNAEISLFHRGIVLSDVSGITIRGNEIHDVRSVAINGADISNAVIENNYLHDINPWKYGLGGDHGDFIHLWTAPATQTSASTNIIIRDNYLAQGNGTATLGIYLDDNDNGLGFTGVQITGNLIYNGDHQGLRLENVHDSLVDSNILLQSSGELKKGPGIVLQGDTSGLTITNNAISGLDLGALTGDSRGNVLVQSIDATKANFSGNLAGDTLSWLEAHTIWSTFTGHDYLLTETPGAHAGLPDNSGSGVGDPPAVVDTTKADAGDNVITGGATQDVLAGLAGADTINGCEGNDLLYSAALPADTIGISNDCGAERDVLRGGGGDDSLWAGVGDDVDGGTGFDTLRFCLAGATQGILLDTAALTAGAPAVVLGGTIQSIERVDYIMGSAFSDKIVIAAQDSAIDVHGGAGDDLFVWYSRLGQTYGETGNDTLEVAAGVASFAGGDGDDTLVSGAGADLFDGNAGNDTVDYRNAATGVLASLQTCKSSDGDTFANVENVSGSNFSDTLTGNGLANILNGRGGNDSLTGDAGNDVLNGGEGDDTLAGGTGNDLLLGGSGNDVFQYAAGGGCDVIGDCAIGDVVKISGYGAAQSVSQVGGDVLVKLSLADTITFSNTDVATVQAALQFSAPGRTMVGSKSANTLNGTSGDDTIQGLAGNDKLSGLAGNDVLEGGSGSDTLNGGDGNDILRGGIGNDILTGGLGADRFQFEKLPGSDRITDFQLGSDKLDFSLLGISAGDVSWSMSRGVLVVSVDADHNGRPDFTVSLNNVVSLGSDDIIFADTASTASVAASPSVSTYSDHTATVSTTDSFAQFGVMHGGDLLF